MCHKITEIDKNQENSCRATVLGSKCDEKIFALLLFKDGSLCVR